MAVFCPLSTTPVVYQGEFVVGALINIYEAGTTTPRTAYITANLDIPYATNGITSDANGCLPEIWIDGTDPYKVRIRTPEGVLVREVDNLPGASGDATVTPTPDTAIETGDVVWAYRTDARSGWVRPLNGKTIGSASSGATERANADAEDLFLFLYAADTNLAVSGGRGASAAADWAANKALTLPDLSLRTIIGLDANATGRLTGATFSYGTGTTLGAYGGTGAETLSTAQLPVTTATGSIASGGSHDHTASSGSSGSHNHAGATGGVSTLHTHNVNAPFAITGSGRVADTGGDIWFGAGAPAITSTESVDHSHAIGFDGLHTHTVTVNSGGAHSHTLTMNSFGSGATHNNAPPFIVMTPYMRL